MTATATLSLDLIMFPTCQDSLFVAIKELETNTLTTLAKLAKLAKLSSKVDCPPRSKLTAPFQSPWPLPAQQLRVRTENTSIYEPGAWEMENGSWSKRKNHISRNEISRSSMPG